MEQTAFCLPTVEREVLSALLRDRSAIVAVQGLVVPEDFQDATNRQIVQTLWGLYENHSVVNKATILAALPQTINQGYVDSLAYACTRKNIEEVAWNATAVHTVAVKGKIDDTLSRYRIVLAQEDKALSEIIQGAVQEIAAIQNDVLQRDSSVGSVGESFFAQQQKETRSVLTGLDWLDTVTGGFGQGTIWVVASPYKMRKSTLVRNFVLSACRSGASMDWYNLERNREYHYQMLLCMVANQHLLAQGRELLDTRVISIGRLDSDQLAAMQIARDELAKFNLRIYDGRDGITQVSRVVSLVQRNRIINGLDGFALDHMQLLASKSPSIYERISSATTSLQNIVVEQQVFGILVSQLNEASVKEHGAKDSSYSIGTKGGGDLPAAGDVIITTEYNAEERPNQLMVRLRLSRDSGSGYKVHTMEPASGLITD